MKKYLRFFATLLFLATSTGFLVSCGEKDKVTDSTEANNTVSLDGTRWEWRHPDADHTMGMLDVSVEFNGPRLVSVTTTDMSTGILTVKNYLGTYSCSGNNGTLALRDDDTETNFNATFTVNGSTMTLQCNGDTYTLTKKQ